jgi:hypothetical protein
LDRIWGFQKEMKMTPTFLTAFEGPPLTPAATVLMTFFASDVTGALGFDGDFTGSSDALLVSSTVPFGLASVVVAGVSTGLVISLFSDVSALGGVIDSWDTSGMGSSVDMIAEGTAKLFSSSAQPSAN